MKRLFLERERCGALALSIFISATMGHAALGKCELNEKSSQALMIAAIKADDSECVKEALSQGQTAHGMLRLTPGNSYNFEEGLPALHLASRLGSLNAIETLVSNGAKLDYAGWHTFGFSPLHYAAYGGKLDAVKLLVKLGADKDITPRSDVADGSGTPLRTAVKQGQVEIVEYLLGQGADASKIFQGSGSRDSSPLHKAACSDKGEPAYKVRIELIKMLLKHGAEPDAQSSGSLTPLICASMGNDTEVARVLIAGGARVDFAYSQRYGTGYTNTVYPLVTAAGFGQTEMVKLLLDEGANVDVQESGGVTALYYASRKGHTQIVKLLLAEHAAVNVIVKQSGTETAFDVAMKSGHSEIADLIKKAGGVPAAELED